MYTLQQKKCHLGTFRDILCLYFSIVQKMEEPIKTRWLVSVMLIIAGFANLTIWNPIDDYLVRFMEPIC